MTQQDPPRCAIDYPNAGVCRTKEADRSWWCYPCQTAALLAEKSALLADREALREALKEKESEAACIIGVYCAEHRFFHGAEAEELRQQLAKLDSLSVNAILDEVDARDSLAYVEKQATAALRRGEER